MTFLTQGIWEPAVTRKGSQEGALGADGLAPYLQLLNGHRLGWKAGSTLNLYGQGV